MRASSARSLISSPSSESPFFPSPFFSAAQSQGPEGPKPYYPNQREFLIPFVIEPAEYPKVRQVLLHVSTDDYTIKRARLPSVADVEATLLRYRPAEIPVARTAAAV